MRWIHAALALTLAVLLPAVASAVPAGYVLTLEDEFEGTELDTSIWDHRLPGPRRDAINVPEAVSLDGAGNLVITTWTEDDLHFTGMIGTEGRFEQRYGWFEARIDFDGSPGMWSAFWLQSPTLGAIIGDPGNSGVEMDIVEHDLFGSQPGAPYWHGALHWDGYGADHKVRSRAVAVPDIADGFHTFALEWTPDALRFYYDGQLMWTPQPIISHVPEFMILSSEVLDSFLTSIPEGGYGSFEETTTRMVVDYVRVYSFVPEPGTALLLGAGLLGLSRRAAPRSDRASTRP